MTWILDRLRREGGFTMIELMVAGSLGVLVLSGTLKLFNVSYGGQDAVAERSADIRDAQVAVDRLTREIREGSGISKTGDNEIELITLVRTSACGSGEQTDTAIQCRVNYSCEAGACTRTESNPAGGGGATEKVFISGLATNHPKVFNYTPNKLEPRLVEVTLSFDAPDTDDDSITLTGGSALRNALMAG